MKKSLLIVLLVCLYCQLFSQERRDFQNRTYIKKQNIWYDINNFKVDTRQVTIHVKNIKAIPESLKSQLNGA